MALELGRTSRGAAAGAVAAALWAAQQPLDKRVFGCRYDDVELLGRMVRPQGRARCWYPLGLGMHVGNGALFGATYASVAPRLSGVPAVIRGPGVALAEHVGLWPLGRASDRLHPARRSLPQLTGNRCAFWQGAWRHLLFGIALGELEQRLNRAGSPVPAGSRAP